MSVHRCPGHPESSGDLGGGVLTLGVQPAGCLDHVRAHRAGVYRAGSHAGAKANFAFRRRRPLAYDHRDVEHQKRLLSEAMAGMPWRVPQLLSNAVADPDFYFDPLSQVRMPSWSAGRVALVGDAAYCASPVSGAGAMLALVGAYRLAGELAAADGDHRVAFRRYEDGHRGLVGRAQSGLFTGLVVPNSRVGIWARNTMARLPLLGVMAGLERRLQPRTAPLPDYGRGAGGTRPGGGKLLDAERKAILGGAE